MTTTMPAPPVYRSSVGKKFLMAASGLALVGFVIAHMIGNLKIFLSGAEINTYAEFLRRMGEPIFPHTVALWLLRSGLIVAFVLHVYFAIDLTVRNRKARQQRYARPDHVQANIPSVTMRWGGLFLLLFIIFHLAHFTWGWFHPNYTFVRGDVYHNTVQSFRQWWLTSIYVAMMIALCLHLYHGTWSMFQTFGVNSVRWNSWIRKGASAVAVVVFLGFSAVPVGVLTHAIT